MSNMSFLSNNQGKYELSVDFSKISAMLKER